MKAFKLMMMAGMMAFATAASAQKQCLTAEDVEFEAGEAEAELAIDIDYETDKEIVSWGFSLYLPDGVSIEYTEEDGTLWWEGSYGKANAKIVQKAANLDITQKDDGGYLILGYASGNPKMSSTHGNLVNLTLITSQNTTGTGTIKNTSMAYLDTVDGKEAAVSADQGLLDDVEFTVDATQAELTTGIKDIKSVDTTAPAYNLQGIRVNNAKGLIIRDGKKMIVK